MIALLFKLFADSVQKDSVRKRQLNPSVAETDSQDVIIMVDRKSLVPNLGAALVKQQFRPGPTIPVWKRIEMINSKR